MCFTGLSKVAHAGDYLGHLTWPEAAQRLPTTTVIIPVAAGAKEHGPHLPLNTDHLVLEHLLHIAVDRKPVIVAPPVLHGWFPSFRDYPGTEIADATIFQNYLQAIAESLIKHGAQSIVFLNTGITRATGLPISIVARDLKANHNIATLVVSWDDLETAEADAVYEQERGGHADEGETSIMLHLAPSLVQMDKAVKDYRTQRGPQIGYAPGKFERHGETEEIGVFGDPTLANANKGEQLLQIMQRNWLTALDQFMAAHPTRR